MSKRSVVEKHEKCTPVEVAFDANTGAKGVEKALLAAWRRGVHGGGDALLLAHAHDGVIWGRVMGGTITTANEAGLSDVALNVATLQQVRVFNAQGELFVWRTGDHTWQARTIYAANDGATYTHALDEHHWLYGDKVASNGNGFAKLSHGSQGLHHAVPVDGGGVTFPVTLTVRHLFRTDDTGALMLAASRLVGLSTVKLASEEAKRG